MVNSCDSSGGLLQGLLGHLAGSFNHLPLSTELSLNPFLDPCQHVSCEVESLILRSQIALNLRLLVLLLHKCIVKGVGVSLQLSCLLCLLLYCSVGIL